MLKVIRRNQNEMLLILGRFKENVYMFPIVPLENFEHHKFLHSKVLSRKSKK